MIPSKKKKVHQRVHHYTLSITPYLFGWLYERIVNSRPWLKGLRILIIAEMRKTG